jgi:hypothetical protein
MKYLTTYIVFLLVIIIALAGGFIYKRNIMEGHRSCRTSSGYPYYEAPLSYYYPIPYPPINYPPPSYYYT